MAQYDTLSGAKRLTTIQWCMLWARQNREDLPAFRQTNFKFRLQIK